MMTPRSYWGDAIIYIDDTPRSHGGRGGLLYRVDDTRYYIDGGARLYIYLGASRLYIWARHDTIYRVYLVARQYIDVPRPNIDARAQIYIDAPVNIL